MAMRFRAVAMLAALAISSAAQGGPLEGKDRNLLLGDWVRMDGTPSAANVEAAFKTCSEPLLAKIERESPAFWKQAPSVPGLLDAKGKISLFQFGERVLFARAALEQSGQYFSAVYTLDHAELQPAKAGGIYRVVSFASEWQLHYQKGWQKTRNGEVLGDLPIELAESNALLTRDYFTIGAGRTPDGKEIGLLYYPVDAEGSGIKGESKQYVRCGGLTGI